MVIEVTDVINTFEKLIKVQSNTGHEKTFMEYVMKEFSSLGLDVTISPVPNGLSNGGNLLCTLHSSYQKKPLFFATHLDTVKEEKMIELKIEDEYINSKHNTILAADPKITIAVMLELVKHIKEHNLPHGTIQFVFTVAEEQGCKGALHMNKDSFISESGYVVDHIGKVGTIYPHAKYRNKIELDLYTNSHANLTKSIKKLIQNFKKTYKNKNLLIRILNLESYFLNENLHFKLQIELSTNSYCSLENYIEKIIDKVNHYCMYEDLECDYNFEEPIFGYKCDENGMLINLFKESCQQMKLELVEKDSEHLTDANYYHYFLGKEVANLAVGFENIHTNNEKIALSEVDNLFQLMLRITQNHFHYINRIEEKEEQYEKKS